MAFKVIDGLRTIEFGHPGESRQKLNNFIINGNKRATAGLATEYLDENEPIEHATRRVLNEELGFTPSVLDKKRFLGVWDHFYLDSAFSPNIGTHYVNLAYSIEIDISDLDHASLPLDQHSEWFWVGLEDIDLLNQTHQYARVYVEIALKQAI